MSFLATGVTLGAIGGIAGAVGNASAASSAAKNQRMANDANFSLGIQEVLAKANLETAANKQNVGLNLGARGAPLTGPYVDPTLRGSQSAVLPFFFGNTEAQAGRDAAAIYNLNREDPNKTMSDYDALLKKYASLVAASERTAAGVVNGGIEKEMLDNARPVFEKRLAVAKNSAMDALEKTLAHTDEIQAGRGYSGDSLGKRMVEFGARKQMGNDVGMASLQNEADAQAIKQSALQLRIGNIGLPDQLTAAAMTRKQLPDQGVSTEFNNRLQPFGFFKLTPNNAAAVQAPTVSLPRVQAVPVKPNAWEYVKTGMDAAGNYLGYGAMYNKEEGIKGGLGIWGIGAKK